MNGQAKISGLEAGLLLTICFLFDLFDFLVTPLDYFFGLGEALKLINNVIASFILWTWATIKGMRQSWLWAGNLAEMLPLVNAFPARTITMAITLKMERKISTGNALA